jgi:CHAT domain-containing protein/Tfp pilus assembly protein PilF
MRAIDEASKLVAAGQYAEAVPYVERAVVLQQGVYGEEHPRVATTLHLLALIHGRQGHSAKALQLLERGLTMKEAALGKEHPEVAELLNSLARIHAHQGQYLKAVPLYERTLEIREAALGKSHPDVAESLRDFAGLYAAQGQYVKAVQLMERAVAVLEAARGEKHPDVAILLQSLAVLYQGQGQYARAEPLLERALAIEEAARGESSLEAATVLQRLASLYEENGQYARAEPLYERALAIQEAARGRSHPDVADMLNALAGLHQQRAQYARAEPLYERALAIQEAARGGTHPDVAGTLGRLASLYQKQGQYARAEPLYERALAIQEAVHGGSHPDVAIVLSKLASLYQKQGQYARAEPLYERALAIQEAARGKEHLGVAIALKNVAGLYAAQGQYARAEPLYERALAIWEVALGRQHPGVATLLDSLAMLQLHQQHLDAALPLFERAFLVSEQHLRQEVLGSSEARLANVLGQLRDSEERFYALVRTHPDDERVRHLAFSAALLRKGRSAEEFADTSRIIYRGLSLADRQSFEDLRALRTRLSALSFAGPGQRSVEDYQQRLAELTERGQALEAAFVRRSERLRALHALPPASEILRRVAATLPRDGALVEYITSHRSQAEPHYLALLLFADGHTQALDLGPVAAIDRAAQRLRAALADRAVDSLSTAGELHALVFQPLVPYLSGARRLFLAPDGQLALIPFSALHDGERFLVDSWDITYLTSGRDLLRRSEVSPVDLQRHSKPRPAAAFMVVVANPDFGSAPAGPERDAQGPSVSMEAPAWLEDTSSPLSARDFADQVWLPLPGTQKEAEALQRLVPHARLLLGQEATKEALLELQTPGVLHIATHGFFLEDASTSKDTRAVKHFGAVGDTGPVQRPPDSLLRSGLVLAGARAGGTVPGTRRFKDSLVTALELAGLDLWGTQLVVLSACDTGRGDVKVGEGVYGLRRALLVAGAETVVTSLWKVNDEATGELMEAYYRHLLAGHGRTTALREAMKELRQKRPHPYYWAPFIAVGQDGPLRGLAP